MAMASNTGLRSVLNLKILGFPVRIDNKKYARNAFYFNLCFVFDSWARSVQYEPLVKKLSEHLTAMEVENNFLSLQEQNSSNREQLVGILNRVLYDINNHRICTLSEGTMTTHLKVVRVCSDPSPVQDHQVPIFLDSLDVFGSEEWDLTTQQVLPYIDGLNHVAKIASEANVENNLVKSCLQNLVYYGLVCMVPIFQYSNMYVVTPNLRKLVSDKRLYEECLRSVAKTGRQLPHMRDVFRMYAGMTHGTTVQDLCLRFNPVYLNIDERRLVQFGVLEGLIRRVERFPVVTTEGASGRLHSYFTGLHSIDELCCVLGLEAHDLIDQVDRDSACVFITK